MLPAVAAIRISCVDELTRLGTALFQEHYDEVALQKHVLILDPDWLRYRALEQQDKLAILAAFEGEQLCGYSVNFISTHLHYASTIVLQNDLLFVTKDKRKGTLGTRLIEATEELARERHCHLITWHAKEATALEQLLRKRGYSTQDILLSKEVT